MTAKSAPLPPTVARLPSGYLRLLGEFPLRPIRTNADYDTAAALVHRLAMREGRLTSDEEEYLEVLDGLVEQFDRVHHSIDTSGVTPTTALQTLVHQAGMTVTELGRLLGSKGAASELLSGKREEPSKAQIAILCSRFKVEPSLFLRQRATDRRSGSGRFRSRRAS